MPEELQSTKVVTDAGGGKTPSSGASFADTAREGVRVPEAATKAEEKPFNYDEWLAAQPKEAIDATAERYRDGVNKWLSDEYGDLLPVILEVKSDPELRKRFAKLTDRKKLEFLVTAASDVYDQDIAQAKAAATGGEAPSARELQIQQELEELKNKQQESELASQRKEYETYRRDELTALLREAPDLRYEKADPSDPAYKRAAHVAEVAENRTRANYERGIQRVVTYREVYDELRDVLGREKPPAAPATSSARADDKPQAPRTIAESRDRMKDTLDRAGGFRSLAVATNRR